MLTLFCALSTVCDVSIPFFRSLRENRPWSKRSLLGSMFKFKHYQAGETVVQEGDVGDTFFVVVDGSVEGQ
jgi:CRP-like cAMP-binding protein